jgi:hypothetical protein
MTVTTSASPTPSTLTARPQARTRRKAPASARSRSAQATPARLRELLDAHVAASPHVLSARPDPIFESFWNTASLRDERVAVLRVRLGSGPVTLVAVPSGVWARGGSRARILALKRAAVRAGRRVLVVPEGALRREPRLGNAVMLAQAASADIGPEDRIAVMALLAEEPGMVLGDLIQAVRQEDDRVAAVLSLARRGIVEVDLRGPIGPLSQVWLRAGQI